MRFAGWSCRRASTSASQASGSTSLSLAVSMSTSCCNNADCRPTRAYVDDNGRWRAWNGTMWLVVPWDRVLPTDFAGDGRSHLCEKGEFIYCFMPGEVRS
jgi:hypothetical protein